MNLSSPKRSRFLSAGFIGAVLGWMYAPVMLQMSQSWNEIPEYSHGWLIPVFAFWVAWSNRGRDAVFPVRGWNLLGCSLFAVGLGSVVASTWFDGASLIAATGSVLAGCGAGLCLARQGDAVESKPQLWGGALLAVGLIAFVGGGYLFIDWLSAAAIIGILWGLAVMACDRERRASALMGAAFLVFMIPLPYSLEVMMRDPLRKVATQLSTYLLQVMSFPCITEGYVILINDSRIGVTEACSGLSMLMVFAALTFGFIIVVPRPLWYRGILAISWPAIAVIANVFRIVTTGGLFALGYDKLADITFHDLAGLAMMPVGLALLWGEQWYLDRLIVVDDEARLGSLLGDVSRPALTKTAALSRS